MMPPAPGMPGMPGGAAAPPMFGAPGLMPPAPEDEGVRGKAVPAPMPNAPDLQPAASPVSRPRKALEDGWSSNDHDLALWLDKMYSGDWAPMLKKAADLPTSPFDNVRDMTVGSSLSATQTAREVAVVLTVRGLQRQAAGDDEAYIENLRIGLSLSRSLHDRTLAVDLLAGRAVEGDLLTGLDRWLEKLHGRPDLIRKALALLSSHLEETAKEGKDQEAAQDLMIQNTFENPFPFLQMYLTSHGSLIGAGSDRVRDEELWWVIVEWLVPWEHARQERVFRLIAYGNQEQLEWLSDRRSNLGPMIQSSSNVLIDIGKHRDNMRNLLAKPRRLCAARAMQLKLALRWYQADHGKPADNLDELVPKYLPSIPLDLYDGEPFRYRLCAAKRSSGLLRLMPIDRVFHKEDSAGSGHPVERRRRQSGRRRPSPSGVVQRTARPAKKSFSWFRCRPKQNEGERRGLSPPDQNRRG